MIVDNETDVTLTVSCSDLLAQSAQLAYRARRAVVAGGLTDSCLSLCDMAGKQLQKSMDLPSSELNNTTVMVSVKSFV